MNYILGFLILFAIFALAGLSLIVSGYTIAGVVLLVVFWPLMFLTAWSQT